MEVEVLDLTSPAAPAPRRRGRSAGRAPEVVDLITPPPPAAGSQSALSHRRGEVAVVHFIPDRIYILSDDEEPEPTRQAVRPPPPPPPPPPRRLAESGRAQDLRRRGALPLGPDGEALCRWCKREVEPPRRTFCGPACVHQHRLRSDTSYARQKTFERDLGRCASCGLQAHLLFCGAAAAASAPPPAPLSAPGRSSLRKWTPVPVLKSLLRACAAAAGEPAWRASVKGRAKARPQLLAEALGASVRATAVHSWPPAVLLAISAGEVECGAAGEGEEEEGGESDADEAGAAAALAAEPGLAAAAAQLARWLSVNGFHSAVRAPKLAAGSFWQMDHRLPVAEGGGSCGLDNLRTLCTPCHAVETARLAQRLAGARKADKPPPPKKARGKKAAAAA